MSTESNSTIIDLDTTVYRLIAIKKAAYKFGDRCHILIKEISEGKVRVTLKPKGVLVRPQHLLGEFQNEVLDQELREVLAAETEGIRNLILAQAYSQTSLLDPQGEGCDYHDDPLAIRQPDSQKPPTMTSGPNEESR